MIKACIFDMDGTTVDTINSIAYFANKALNKHSLPSIDTEKYKEIVGDGARVLVERMIKETGGNTEKTDLVFKEYSSTYDNDFLYLAKPYEGVMELLNELKQRGIKVAILSNKPDGTTKKISNALFGDELIDICLGGVDGMRLKPCTDGLMYIIDKLSLKKEECLYIGDTSTDMKTGKNGGVFTIGVLWGFRKRDELEREGADAIVSHPSEILRIIEKNKGL